MELSEFNQFHENLCPLEDMYEDAFVQFGMQYVHGVFVCVKLRVSAKNTDLASDNDRAIFFRSCRRQRLSTGFRHKETYLDLWLVV